MLTYLLLIGLCLSHYPGDGSQPKVTRRQQRAEVEAFAKQRSAEIKSLITITKDNIGKPGRVGVTAVAIRKLGRMRAVEATDFLVDHLSFDGLGDEVAVSPLPVLEELSPCVFCASGDRPSSIPETDPGDRGDGRRDHAPPCGDCLEAVDGRGIRVLLFLRHQHDSQKDETKKRRLKSTMELLKEVKGPP